ncbi:MAG TPA: MBL fold metallo-hydrolase, partial [Candidatus Acidoferrales bacterium]|nr:MBL fold metallo-hydrolase [Candidatus Acidoferrales bacterium]
VDVSDLMLMPWSIPSGRRTPLEVWGPQGTREMMRHLQAAFRFDIHIRRDVDEKLPSDGIKVISHDIREGTVYEKNGVKVRAFIVDHGPVKPAYGYRLDYAGRSIALSGDTRPTDNLVKHCQGVDVLIHEAVDPETLRRLNAPEELFRAIVAHHTTPEQAGEIFSRVRPKLAVFSHYNTASVLGRAKETYSGRIELGDDLMVIDIADDVTVTRRQ